MKQVAAPHKMSHWVSGGSLLKATYTNDRIDLGQLPGSPGQRKYAVPGPHGSQHLLRYYASASLGEYCEGLRAAVTSIFFFFQ